jgi:hypothetical protein
MSLARAFERRGNVASTTTDVSSYRAPWSRLPVASTALATPATSVSSPMPSTRLTRSRFHRLSPKEMAKKRKKGECYFCSEKFTPEHNCASKGVFLMELEEDDTVNDLTEDLKISPHALTGLVNSNTMQLMINIAGTDLRALVDSGSTHIFIHDAATLHLGLRVTMQPGLSVKVANGEHFQSYGACKATNILIQGETFRMDCYTLPLEGFDVILGVQWLWSLGSIVWDFVALSMALVHDECTLFASLATVVHLMPFTPWSQRRIFWILCSTHMRISLKNHMGWHLNACMIIVFIFCLARLQLRCDHIDTHNYSKTK